VAPDFGRLSRKSVCKPAISNGSERNSESRCLGFSSLAVERGIFGGA
jgi:hypothetical protein